MTKEMLNTALNLHTSGDCDGAQTHTEVPMVLLGKYLVEADVLIMVKRQVKRMRPFLMPANDYTWQDLLGDDFWSDRPDLPIQLAKICLQHLAHERHSLLTVSPNRDRSFATCFQIN